MGASRVVAIITATVILIIIILSVIWPYVIIIRMLEYNNKFTTIRLPRAKISDIYPHLKTGDILLFAAATQIPMQCGISKDFYSHTGMILREGELVYVTEAQIGAELMPNPNIPGTDYHLKIGTTVSPLLTRLKFYTGQVCVMRLSRSLDFDREQIIKSVTDKLHNEVYAYPTIKQVLSHKLLGNRNIKARHCFQHVAHLLDSIGLTPLDRRTPFADAGFVKCCNDICVLSGRSLPDNYYYEDPIQIIYDIDCIKFDDSIF